MKLLKCIFAIFLLLQATTSFAQTKEEKINWLKETLQKYIIGLNQQYTDCKLESIDECKLVFSYKYKSQQYLTTLPTSIKNMPDVGGFFPLGKNGRGFMYETKTIYTKNIDSGKGYKHRYFGSVKVYVPYEEKEYYIKIEEALKHLAALCNTKL